MSATDYDVIIVGGGIVGATLALGLAQQTALKLALIEPYPPQPMTETEPPDMRVSAITPASIKLFEQLGVWQQLFASRISPFSDMHVWETSDSSIHFDSADIGEATLGHIVENRHLQTTLLAACQTQDNIDCLNDKPNTLNLHADSDQSASITLDNHRTLTADLIVAADGARSPLREWAGIQSRGWDYDQHAVVCTVTTAQPHQRTAWQRFLSTGPLAFLPLNAANQCSIVWSTTPDHAEQLCALEDAEFCQQLTAAFEMKLGDVQHSTARASFPLRLRHAHEYVKPRFALVGDAAHTIHPLAGQGVNIGLKDVVALTHILTHATASNRAIGSLHTLRKYQRQRKADNIATQLTMDVFKRLFGSQLPPLKWTRQFGLQQVNRIGLFKQQIMHRL